MKQKENDLSIAQVGTMLNDLFRNVKTYKNSKNYMEMLRFCARFKTLSPFNAFLIQTQRPSAKYVLSEAEWRTKYNRRIIMDSRPMIILNYRPVNFVFDISDTEAIDPDNDPAQAILDQLANPYTPLTPVDETLLNRLTEKLCFHGIKYVSNFRVGNNYGARIQYVAQDQPKIHIPLQSYGSVEYPANYVISTNSTSDIGARFASVLHELGHLFCHHIIAPSGGWWKVRPLSHSTKEFEAESVSWLICEMNGIVNPSEKYLSHYLLNNNQIPSGISVADIFDAVVEINKLFDPTFCYRDGLLYKNDKRFKDGVKAMAKLQWKNKPVDKDGQGLIGF